MRAVRFLAITLLLSVLLVGGLPRAAHAESGQNRAALLIANAAYPDSDALLPTPIEDTRALAEELKRRGFSVEVGENLTREAMQAAIDRFTRRVENGTTALVFFAGYGIQVGRKNYLIPVDARIWSESDVLRDGLAVDGLMADLDKRGPSERVLVLDASRRNPFERRFRSFSTGLAPAKAGAGTLTFYSAAAGSVVNEGNANRSLFVTELVKQIALPEQSAEQAFEGCREALSKATRNQQNPALASGLQEVFSFDPNGRKQAAKPKTKPAEKEPPKVVETKPVETKPVEIAKAPIDPPVSAETQTETATLPKEEPVTKVPETKPVETKAPETKTTILANKDAGAPLSTEEETVRDFDAAQAAGTISAYKEFLGSHPTGSLAARARAEIARLEAAEQAATKPKQPAPYSQAELKRKSALDQRITKNARDATAYYERGQFHAQRGDAAPAIADFDQAIRLDPSNPEAFNNRCWMRAVSNDLQGALSDCNQSLALRRNFLDALDSRGFVNLKLGEYRAAVADYDAALKIDASHGSALYGRGVARRHLGQTAQGDKDLASALQLNPAIDQEFAQYGLR